MDQLPPAVLTLDIAVTAANLSMARRDKQRQRVTHPPGYREGYKRLPLYALSNGLGRIARLDHGFAIGMLRFAG